MKTKTPDNNTSQWNVLKKPTLRNNQKNILKLKHVKIITAEFKNRNKNRKC